MISRKKIRLAALLMTFTLLLSSVLQIQKVSADSVSSRHGRIVIQLEEFPETDMEKVKFYLYPIGIASEEFYPRLFEEFGGTDIPQQGGALDKKAKELACIVKKNDSQASALTDKKGYLMFDNLANGVYLLIPENTERYGLISPFIVVLPYTEFLEGNETPFIYDIAIEPKSSPNGDIPTVTLIPTRSPAQPTTPVEPTQKPNNPTENSEASSNSDEVKTGDNTPVGFYLVLGVCGIVLIIIIVKKRKVHNK